MMIRRLQRTLRDVVLFRRKGGEDDDDSRVETYAEAVNDYLAQTRPVVDYLSHFDWDERSGHYEMLLRAILRRQDEGLAAILELCKQDRGDAAVSLLRPACEEYIVATYLNGIDREQAQRFIIAASALDTDSLLQAQQSFAGVEVMRDLGFSERFVTVGRTAAEAANAELLYLGEELGWPAPRQPWPRQSPIPSMRYFAKERENLDIYDFLYHATSRFVHFKVNELFRRVWGNPPRMSISSAHFREHWTMFALYWGLWLHLHTFGVVSDAIEDVPDELLGDEFLDAIQRLGPKVPLVTAREFLWPGRRAPWT